MKNKGFTLIELLAVIVVLAIIALIATPMILNVVEKSRKGAAKSSALGYVDAVEKQIMVNQLNENPEINDGEYSLPMGNKYKISIKGSKPSSGNMTITKSKVVSATMCINNYTVTYNGKTATVGNKCNGTEEIIKKGPTKVEAKTGETHKGIVYLDPTDLSKECNASNSVSTTEVKIGCMKWYIFDDSGDNYTMILDHNTTARIKWNDDNINVAYESSNLKAVVDDLVTTNGWKLIPRLITAEEVNQVTGKTGWTNTSSWHCLESKVQDKTSNPYCNNTGKLGWLYDHTYCVEGSNDWKCLNNDTATYGYWTSTTYESPGTDSIVWQVYRYGDLDRDYANSADYGVRPVITINKTTIN